MVLGDHLADGAARRVADVVGGVDLEDIHQPQHVLRHLLDGVRDAREGGLPGASVVVDDHPEEGSE
jgi:hypothetical protein